MVWITVRCKSYIFVIFLHALTANLTDFQSYEWTLCMAWGFFVSQYLFQLFTFLLNHTLIQRTNQLYFIFPMTASFQICPFVLLHGTNDVGYFLQNGHFFVFSMTHSLQKYTAEEHPVPLNTFKKCSMGTWVSVNKTLE